MSVIVTGVDLPSKCAYCDAQFNYECRYTRWHCKDFFDKRSDDCPMKSVEGLIREIREKGELDFKGTRANCKSIKLGMEYAIKIIKEYCEVSE